MNGLQRLSRAEGLLARIVSAPDAIKVARLAEAARVYAREMDLGLSSINHATVIKIRAEKKLAQVIDEGQRNGQTLKHGQTKKQMSASRTSSPPSLADLGVDRQRLAEARSLAKLPDSAIQEAAAAATGSKQELSRASLLRIVKHSKPRTPRERAKEAPEVKWNETLSKLNAAVASMKASGFLKFAERWTGEYRASAKRELVALTLSLKEIEEAL